MRRRVFPALAGVALMALAGTLGAQELGRLFFTPDQRQALDARRKARVPDKPAAAAVAAPTLRLDGYVQRSSGRSTVWVNGESLSESGQADAPRIGRGTGVSVNVGEGGSRVEMRPGEVLDRGNGEVRDVIGDGQIKVRPGVAK
jgi:hypothetical protein